jgi:hypothetical protein
MPKKAYALKESVKDFAGGSVALPDGSTLDLAPLKDGGTITTADPARQRALEQNPAVKAAALDDKSKPAAAGKED